MKNIDEIFYLEELEVNISRAIDNLLLGDDRTDCYRVLTLVSGGAGQYATKEFFKLVGIDEYPEVCSDEYCTFFAECMEALTDLASDWFSENYKGKYETYKNSIYLWVTQDVDDSDICLKVGFVYDFWDTHFVCSSCGSIIGGDAESLSGKDYCHDCYKNKVEELFLDKWNNGGSFMHHLCETLCRADYSNLERLHKGFPELVDGYCMYSQGHLFNER